MATKLVVGKHGWVWVEGDVPVDDEDIVAGFNARNVTTVVARRPQGASVYFVGDDQPLNLPTVNTDDVCLVIEAALAES